ncbi:MAG: right-handed parallel beta-helix repeat-containing protein [Bacteroidaceae bacterium]|nr:right-handed parallel beta-helix repeat-containing protein [Bacteroidaceae bacterium]
MRKIIMQTLVSALLMMIPACMMANESASKIVVHNGVEFIKALGSNRTVVIASGSHINLTDEIFSEGLEDKLNIKNIELIVNPAKVGKNGLLQYNYQSDGVELHLAYMKNLTIEGEGMTRPVIQVRPRYTYILSFDHCENITVKNLEMGHTDEGYCEGGVLSFTDCKGVKVDNCDMYGCGTEGITATNCENLQCEGSIIRDCSYSIMTLTNVKGKVNFSECQFLRNKEFNLVNADANCSKLNFIKCLFKDNRGLLFNVKCPGLLDHCTVVHNYDMGDIEEFENRGSDITQDGDKVYTGDVEDEYEDIDRGDYTISYPDYWKADYDESRTPLKYYLWQGEYMKQPLRMALCQRGHVFIGEALLGEDSAYPIAVRGLSDMDDDVTFSLLNSEDPTVIDMQFTGKVSESGFNGNDASSLKRVKMKNVKGSPRFSLTRNENGFASPWHKNNIHNFDGKDGDAAGNYQYVGPLDKQGVFELWRGMDGDMDNFTINITCKQGAYQYENSFSARLYNHQLYFNLARGSSTYGEYILRIRFYEGFITVTCVEGSPDGVVPSNITLEGIYFEVPSVG